MTATLERLGGLAASERSALSLRRTRELTQRAVNGLTEEETSAIAAHNLALKQAVLAELGERGMDICCGRHEISDPNAGPQDLLRQAGVRESGVLTLYHQYTVENGAEYGASVKCTVDQFLKLCADCVPNFPGATPVRVTEGKIVGQAGRELTPETLRTPDIRPQVYTALGFKQPIR